MSGARRKARGLTGEDLQRLARQRAEARDHAARLQETLVLARARDETVEAKAGRVRVTSRDGLQTLFESGALPRPEYEAGLLYRRCYEAIQAGPRSNLDRDFTVGVRGFSEALAGLAERRAFDAQRLARWETLMQTGRQLWILRLVAGQGRTINSVASGGSARAVNTRALTEALAAIARERGLRAA